MWLAESQILALPLASFFGVLTIAQINQKP